MVKICVSLLLLLTAIGVSHAAGLTTEDRQRYEFCLQQAETLSSNAANVVTLLRSPGPTASSVDYGKLLEDIAATIHGLNLLVGDARTVLQTGNAAVGKVGPTLDRVSASLLTLDTEMKQLGVVLREEIQTTGVSIRTDVKALTEKMSTDLTRLFEAGVQEIRLVGGASQEVLLTIKTQVDGVSTTIRASVSDLSQTLTKLIGEQGASIAETIKALIQAGISSVEKMTADASRLLVTLDSKVSDMGNQLVTSIGDLAAYVAKLVTAMTEFMVETTKTLHDVRVAAEATAKFFTGFHGRITTEFTVAGPNGLDSAAALDMWRDREYDQNVFTYTHLGVRHIETSPKADVEFGYRRHSVDMGFGFIEDGLGLSVGYNRFGDSGLDAGLSASHFREPLLRLDMGCKFKSGIRLFGVLEKPWTTTGGIGYIRGF